MNITFRRPLSAFMIGVVHAISLIACGTTSPEPEQGPEDEPRPITDTESAAQEDEMTEFVSITEFFRAASPAGWSVVETLPGGAFVIASSEAALDRYRAGSAVDAGDLIVNIGFLPDTLLESNELRPLDIQFDGPPDVFLSSLMPMFNPVSGTPLGDPELVTVGEERSAGQVIVVDADQEGMILFLEVGEGVYALISTISAPGEIDQFQDITYSIASQIEYLGPEGELYGLLLGS